MSKDTKPYILRALFDWAVDSGYTPHIMVWVNDKTQVPMQYVRNNEIVLNIGPNAAHNLTIDDEWINFATRFNGVSHDIWIPIGHVSSIFARETGEGMGFDLKPLTDEKGEELARGTSDQSTDSAEKLVKSHPTHEGSKKGLKIIK
ncbi:MAG: ClpXP protease specificity-enhancing factor [Snodgrassella sp.]|nr:ClpXP protease specificity-enhancing factor [Snodgrassella sp.]